MHSALSALGKPPAAHSGAAPAAAPSTDAPAGFEDLLSLVQQALAAMPAVRDAALSTPDANAPAPLPGTALPLPHPAEGATDTAELPLPRLAGLDTEGLPEAAEAPLTSGLLPPVPPTSTAALPVAGQRPTGATDTAAPQGGDAPATRPALLRTPDLPPMPAAAAAENAAAGEPQPAPPPAARNAAATATPEPPLLPAPAVEAPRTAGSLTPEGAPIVPTRIDAALGLPPRGGRSGGGEERAPLVSPGIAAAGPVAPTITTAAATATSHSLPTPAGSAAWSQSVADVLISEAPGQGTGRAQLQLRPENLGGLAIEILQDGDRIELRVNADTAAGRQAFEESLPKLRALFAEQGLQLGNTNVSGGDAQQRGDAARRQAPTGAPAADTPPEGPDLPRPQPAQPRGLLDYYA